LCIGQCGNSEFVLLDTEQMLDFGDYPNTFFAQFQNNTNI